MQIIDTIREHLDRAVGGTVGNLSEKIVQACIANELRRSGIEVQEQVHIPVFQGERIIGYNRIDMVLHFEGKTIVLELKRLRQGLLQSPGKARWRILSQARSYAQCLQKIFPTNTEIVCFVVNVFNHEGRESGEVHAVPFKNVHGKGLLSKRGRLLRNPSRLKY